MAETASLAPSAVNAVPAATAAQLARAWLAALAVTGDPAVSKGTAQASLGSTIPTDAATARAFLTDQSASLLAILFGDPFRPRQAAAVGHALVQADFVNGDVLGRSLRVLIMRLPELIANGALAGARATVATAGHLERRVAELTEALANGYVRALRDRTLAEQESVLRAELDQQRTISEQLWHQANHDPLTGLPNRAAIFGRLATALAAGSGTRVGLCYLDLDGFKAINDRYGHAAGDELLVTVAARIGEAARAHGAIAGRIGGDEFVVLAPAVPGMAAMIALTTGILAEVSRPVPLSAGRVSVSACAGIAQCTAGSTAAAAMVANADTALYRAKSRGSGRWAGYDITRLQAS